MQPTAIRPSLRHPAVITWVVLMVATAASWWLGVDHGRVFQSEIAAAVGVIGISFFKVHCVGRYFMDLRDAPLILVRLFDAWVVGTCAMVIGLYVLL